jgi:hypothetical protein
MVPFEGFEDGLTGRYLFVMQRGRLWGEAASFLQPERLGVRGMGEPIRRVPKAAQP